MHNMYSGSDSTESQKYPQWALNPSAYQNMANDQVDWAALAQQWIIMKEAGPPPIPGEQPVILSSKPVKVETNEGGEAPMEVENDRDETSPWNVSEPPPPPGAEPWNWNAQNQSWNWNNSWVPPSGVPPPPNIGPMKPPLLPTPNNLYSPQTESSSDNAVSFGGYNTSSNNDYNNSGYWTSSGNHKHIKPHNKRYSKVNVPIRTSAPLPPMATSVETSNVPALDAAKRKQLPAWIREGLEKMEKDKLKQIEKEREKQERDEYLKKNEQNEKETMEILKNTMKERQRSKFESEGENSDDEPHSKKKKPVSPDPVPLTPDELMLKVRRMMTEILLNVTTRQIESICKEEHQRYIKKYKASDQRSSAPSGANISAKLGLGMYDDGSGSSGEEDEEDYQYDNRDSDTELKDVIKRKMAEFQKTEKEIEDKLEEAERRRAGSISRSSSLESNDNDSQVDARVQGRRHHVDDKLSPRSRPFHDKSKARSSSTSSEGSNYSNNRSKTSRRSSSSDTNDSYKKGKKHRSRSYSRTPDKKRKSSLSSRWSRSKSPSKRHSRSDSRSRRGSNTSKKRSSRRSRSRSESRSRRSRSSSYRKSKRSRSRGRSRRTRSRDRSSSRSRYLKRSRSNSRSDYRRSRRRRSRSSSSSRGKRSHRH